MLMYSGYPYLFRDYVTLLLMQPPYPHLLSFFRCNCPIMAAKSALLGTKTSNSCLLQK
jgi:hypothetical protein